MGFNSGFKGLKPSAFCPHSIFIRKEQWLLS